ncbi:MAG: hypothetical protein OEM28_07250 [Nitrosopumilus sp.]|nr:hypothetical protein [Nitrosopumilus sp.]MDH3488059.1 hypothetical protein [Nitrosopumilus sp.]
MGEREVQQEYRHSSKLESIQKEYTATMVYEMLNINDDTTLENSAYK